jgi:hypothetical protein
MRWIWNTGVPSAAAWISSAMGFFLAKRQTKARRRHAAGGGWIMGEAS